MHWKTSTGQQAGALPSPPRLRNPRPACMRTSSKASPASAASPALLRSREYLNVRLLKGRNACTASSRDDTWRRWSLNWFLLPRLPRDPNKQFICRLPGEINPVQQKIHSEYGVLGKGTDEKMTMLHRSGTPHLTARRRQRQRLRQRRRLTRLAGSSMHAAEVVFAPTQQHS